MRHPRVLVLAGETLFRSFFDAPRLRRLGRGFEWTRSGERHVTKRLLRLLAQADALVTTWDSPKFDERLLALAPRLRIVSHCGGEVKGRFARPLFERLTIANAPGPMAHLVAELAVTFLLMAARRVDAYRDALRRPSNRVYADLHAHGAAGEGLRARTVGLLGLGRIGRETVRLLQPFGPQLLAHDPFVDTGEARGLMDEYFQTFGGVRDYLAGVVDEARRTGFTETILGRRRYLPDLSSDIRQRREMAERMALNAPIQGSAADLIKVAMLRVDAAIREAGLSSRMLLQVHDELVFEAPDSEVERMLRDLPELMTSVATLRVPLKVDVGHGPNWEKAH